MKKVLLLCSALLSIGYLKAQVSITPIPVIIDNVMPGDAEGIAHSTVKNNVPAVRTYRWERTIIQVTDGWDNAVCDKNQCYLPSISTMEFQLGPNEEGLLDVHVYPNSIEGMAVIEVKVTDINNANNTATGVYYFNTGPVGINDVEYQALSVYPNPSEGIFTISENQAAAEVAVYDLTGKQLRKFNFAANEWYDIRDLQRGAYIVRLLDRSGETMITRLINKI